MDGIDEATKRMLLAKLDEEVPAGQSERRSMLLSNLKVIQSYADDSSTITLHPPARCRPHLNRADSEKSSTVKPRVQGKDGATVEGCL